MTNPIRVYPGPDHRYHIPTKVVDDTVFTCCDRRLPWTAQSTYLLPSHNRVCTECRMAYMRQLIAARNAGAVGVRQDAEQVRETEG